MTTRKHGPSAAALTDGMVFTTRLSGGESRPRQLRGRDFH
jgi:hypothetical protein